MTSLLLLTFVLATPAHQTSVVLEGAQPNAVALLTRGVTWETFLSTVEAQRSLWQSNARRASVPAALVERMQKAAQGVHLLVIGEGSCSDSVSVVPYVAKLAVEAGIELRIVGREQGRPFLALHRTPDGREATPTILLLRDGQVVGAFVERPAALQEWYLSAGAKLSQGDRYARKMSWYDWDRGDSAVTEIVALAERVAGGGTRHN